MPEPSDGLHTASVSKTGTIVTKRRKIDKWKYQENEINCTVDDTIECRSFSLRALFKLCF